MSQTDQILAVIWLLALTAGVAFTVFVGILERILDFWCGDRRGKVAKSQSHSQPSPDLKAVRVPPNKFGLAPVLQPGQYCKDLEGCWHFRTPEGTYFAVLNRRSWKVKVEEHRSGIRILGGPVKFACEKGIAQPNSWTVDWDVWVKE